METLADNLQKLTEDDLLQVVEMIHNNKTADTYTKNDTERAYIFVQHLPHCPPHFPKIHHAQHVC